MPPSTSSELTSPPSPGTSNVPYDRPNKRRRIRLPARLANFEMHDPGLIDVLPQAPLSVSLSTFLASGPSGASSSGVDGLAYPGEGHPTPKVLDTTPNIFSVFRRYNSTDFPSHDPDAHINLPMLSNIVTSVEESPTSHNSTTATSAFHPYPNQSAFLLGEWYWAKGNQKSQQNFKALLDIVGSSSFSPTDVQSTNWAQVDRDLGVNDWDKAEWIDEDACWIRSTVKIQVPFHRHLSKPGPREYCVTNFYHRSLTTIIREKLSKEADMRHFHYEPYELFWSPPHIQGRVRLHGEFYTSRAFNVAHQELQAAPGELGCSLPRVVVALMLWSDGMALSQFGSAKLWPVYLFFGNESKYRRCKPSNNLCEHVAYFEEVWIYIRSISHQQSDHPCCTAP